MLMTLESKLLYGQNKGKARSANDTVVMTSCEQVSTQPNIAHSGYLHIAAQHMVTSKSLRDSTIREARQPFIQLQHMLANGRRRQDSRADLLCHGDQDGIVRW